MSANNPVVLGCLADGENSEARLLLFGGGEISPEVRERFIQLAGGEAARIVLIPSASQGAENPEVIQSFLEPWQQHAPHPFVVLHARERWQANDPDFVRPLREATGVWITGGVQSRLAERYRGTRVEDELQNLLRRGGVVGGTSAGAAIMTRVMITDGLQRPVLATGFDLFRGAIVDQHFAQRYRMTRLSAAVRLNPQRFGVGIDEATGLLVNGDEGTVIGRGRVRVMANPQTLGFGAPLLLVKDYAAGEAVPLSFWRELAGNEAVEEVEARSTKPKRLVGECRLAPALSYSLMLELEQLDSRR